MHTYVMYVHSLKMNLAHTQPQKLGKEKNPENLLGLSKHDMAVSTWLF